MTPTHAQVYEALRNRPSAYSVPASRLASSRQAWTRTALEAIGIHPSARDLQTTCWSDRIVDLVDETQYFLARHAARLKRRAAGGRSRRPQK